MLILGVLCILFNNNHPELVGGTEDPEDGKEVAVTAGMAIAIYAVGLLPIFHMTRAAGTRIIQRALLTCVGDCDE